MPFPNPVETRALRLANMTALYHYPKAMSRRNIVLRYSQICSPPRRGQKGWVLSHSVGISASPPNPQSAIENQKSKNSPRPPSANPPSACNVRTCCWNDNGERGQGQDSGTRSTHMLNRADFLWSQPESSRAYGGRLARLWRVLQGFLQTRRVAAALL